VGHLAVSAVGADRPGIVAAVTRVFVEHGCNLEDSSMTILRGQFAMMLVVDAPSGVGAGELHQALAEPASALDLVVTVRPLPDEPGSATDREAGAGPGARFTVSVYGADHPGIVHGVTDLLARRGANIVDLSTRMIGDAEHPVYAMVLEVSLPPAVDPDELADLLRAEAAALGVDASLHAADADIL
jgi:glycine cleavage system transcriptional repressor